MFVDKVGEWDFSRLGVGIVKGKEFWGLGYSYILWFYGFFGGVLGSYWELYVEGVKISKVFFIGGVILI